MAQNNMELLNEKEIISIIQKHGFTRLIKWHLQDFEEKIIGYLGDHLKLIIEAEKDGVSSKLQLFVKSMPRFDMWKREYLKELKFFYKEYVMLDKLFQDFHNGEGKEKWRPKLLHIREDLFVFEDVGTLGYKMPHFKDTMTFEALKSTVETLARFHAQSYIYEEKRSKEHGRPYRIWEEYSEYLQEPIQGMPWRDTGRNAAIDFLKTFSKYRLKPNFSKNLEEIMPTLYDKSVDLMRPSDKYRNAVVHRDLWTNNIFIKDEASEPHALLVDFQTVLYSSPMLDLSSLIYFNTLRADRDAYTFKLIQIYYEKISEVLGQKNIDIELIFPKHTLMEAFKESILFGMTQASIIVPIVAMTSQRREEIFCDPIRSEKANLVSRSEEFIEIANEDPVYKVRVCDLLDEIVERFILANIDNRESI